MFFVYIIYNLKYKKFYVGQTEDLAKRIHEHNTHTFKRSYTARFDGVWVIIYSEKWDNRNLALKREKQLKNFSGRQFIKKIIPQ